MSNKQADSFKEKGNALWKQKKFKEAIEQYTYAVECDPNNHIYYTNRAACYASMKEWEKCLRDANRAISKKSDWVKGWFRKGQACFELGKFQEAHDAYSKAYSFDPKPDFKARADAAEKAWKSDMSEAELLKAEGNALFKVGKINDALEKYTAGLAAVKLEETQLKAALHNNRAHCYAQLYDPKKVVQECTKVLEIDAYNVKALLRRAQQYEALEKTRAAMNDYQKVCMIDSNNQLANKGAARTRNRLRDAGKDI